MPRPSPWTRIVWWRQRQNAATFHHLIELLHANERAEDGAYRTLTECFDRRCIPYDVHRVLDVREERVTILYRLGWTADAEGLAEDTAMRRGWLTEDRAGAVANRGWVRPDASA